MKKLLLILFIIPLLGFSQIVTSGGKVVTTSSGLVSLSGGAAPSSYDADAQAYFDLADQSPLTTAQKDAINTFVVGLKADGLWTDAVDLLVLTGGTSTMHKYNLKDPQDTDAAHRAEFFGGLTHDANGVTGNGTNAYIKTHVIPNVDQPDKTSVSSFIYSRTSAAFNGAEFGADYAAVSGTGLYTNYGGTTYFGVSSSLTTGSFASPGGDGFWGVTRVQATKKEVWRNGVRLVNTADNSVSGASVQYAVLAENQTTDIAYRFSNRNISFVAFYNRGLDLTENANLYTLVQALQTALGREITP